MNLSLDSDENTAHVKFTFCILMSNFRIAARLIAALVANLHMEKKYLIFTILVLY